MTRQETDLQLPIELLPEEGVGDGQAPHPLQAQAAGAHLLPGPGGVV